MSLQGIQDPWEVYVEKNPRLQQRCANPRTATALKWAALTVLVLAVIGGLVAMGLTNQFASSGWLNQVVFPVMRKFFEMKANLTIGEGLAYIAAPLIGCGIIVALGYKYILPCLAAERVERERSLAEVNDLKDVIDGHSLLSSDSE